MVQVAAIDSLPAATARRRLVVAALALTLFAIARQRAQATP
jgi:hypothetical protein